MRLQIAPLVRELVVVPALAYATDRIADNERTGVNMKVFWSWQSDSPSRVNKNFVKEALEAALELAADDLNLTEADRPELDHDTKNAAGLVEIAATIFEKVDSADVFVGDVTPVARTDNGKYLPNPNVLIELGYALRALGHKKIILVSNDAFGGRPEDLPFDLRHRRGPIRYDLKPESSEATRKAAKRSLVQALNDALKMNLGISLTERDSTVDFNLIQPSEGDRAIWLAPGEEVVHQDGPRVLKWALREGTRSYIRITPAGWAGEKPTRREVHAARDDIRLSALDPWWHGDGGANGLGVVAVGLDPEVNGSAHSVTQWFESNGEVWGSNALVTRKTANGKILLDHLVILKSWRSFLHKSLAFLDHFRATPPYRVEAGVTGVEHLLWAAQNGDQRSSSLLPEAFFVQQGRDWTEETQIQFLTAAYNSLRDAFNQERLSAAEVRAILKD
jgi:hypothetical protein